MMYLTNDHESEIAVPDYQTDIKSYFQLNTELEIELQELRF